MKTLISIVAAGLLATGSTALAAGETGAAGGDAPHGPRMQGSPNAAGFTGKSDTTGSAKTGAPGSEMPKQDGRMQGPPNAAGFQQGNGGAAGASGSR
jgi:hypothetical protein